MQRLFSMFPVGLPGIGLFCLRLTAALSLSLAMNSTPTGLAGLEWLLQILCFLLVIGLATPLLASCCVVAGVYALVSNGGAGWQCAGIAVPVAVALALLGPGGYSMDARLFGRRSVVLNDPDARSSERRD